MKSVKAHELWCPMGRVSIQQVVDGGRIAVVQTGAFNMATLSQQRQLLPNQDAGGEPLYLSSTCVGNKCPYYRRSFIPWGWGRCALATIDYRPLIALATAAIIGITVLI